MEPKTTTEKLHDVDIFFPDELKKGNYSNSVVISHTPEEFILDFISLAPRAGCVVARIFMSPSHIKRTIKALSQNLAIYEQKFGEVPEEIKPKA